MIKYKCKDKFGITGIVEVEGDLFVTKDKNGKDVFAGDKVKYQKDIGGKTGNYIVEWYTPKAGYILSGIDKETELWNRDWMREYSELIEDKENE
jgi:hypothetical protein